MCFPFDKPVPEDFNVSERTEINAFSVGKLSGEYPSSVSKSGEVERHYFPVSQIVVTPSGPIPDVSEQDSVQQVECLFGAGMPVVVGPSGDYWIEMIDQSCGIASPVSDDYFLQLIFDGFDAFFGRPCEQFAFGIHADILAKKVETI